MSVNKFLEHIFVLPEDDANLQLANGFHLQVTPTRQRQMQVLPVAGGWKNVLELFITDHVRQMDRYPTRSIVLIIDFDSNRKRLEDAKDVIPEHLVNRVFVLGAWTEPEFLKHDLGSYENIGKGMANDCRDGTAATWGHEILRHNESELERLRRHVRSILF